MRRNIHWSVQLAILLGLVGLFVTSISFWVGVAMILVGLAVPIVALRQSNRQPVRSLPRRGPDTKREVAAPERREAVLVSPPPHSVDRNKLGILRYTLHQANLDSSVPVFETGPGKAVTVRDILVEMIDIAESYGKPVEALARDIVAMYPKIFDNVDLALRQYPDPALAKTYIARKAMTDAGWKLDKGSLRNS